MSSIATSTVDMSAEHTMITSKLALSTLERMDRNQAAMEAENSLNESQKQVLIQLKTLHGEHLQYEEQYRKEWNQLKLKYFKKMEPLYQARADKVVGSEGKPGLPNFWLNALKRHSALAQTIESHDEPILAYLENIESMWRDPEEQLSFKIVMTFAENPFFSDRQLTKEFELEDEPETNESVLVRTTGTEISWRQGRNVTKKTVTKRQRNKKTGEVRMVKMEKDRESFFHFFTSHEIPDDDTLEIMRDRDVQELENTLEIEYELGCILRDRIIPHAVGWYLDIEIDSDEDEDEDSEEEDEEQLPANSDDDEDDSAEEEIEEGSKRTDN